MAMRACEKCGANTWEFTTNDGLVLATCQNCWNEVSWMPKPKTKNHFEIGDLCNKCKKTGYALRKSKKKAKNKYYLWCHRCNSVQINEKYNSINE